MGKGRGVREVGWVKGNTTHDFKIVLDKIPAFVDSAVLALAYGGPTQVLV